MIETNKIYFGDCPDSPRYKACGNAITVAVGGWVLKRLAKEISK